MNKNAKNNKKNWRSIFILSPYFEDMHSFVYSLIG